MDKPSLTRLPPGFRFHPTDEELVSQYLKRKVLSWPLPCAIIPEIELYKYNPWDLPGGCGEERYFFNLREPKFLRGNRSNRLAKSGYWKATGKEKEIFAASGCSQVVGLRRSLVFYQGKAPRGTRTDWVMHEYRLAHLHSGWVLCRIFRKKRAATKMEEPEVEHHMGLIDFMRRRPSSPSVSDSSCVTEISDESSQGDETSST
ncbi:NAC domain-containing protein 83-like [Typha latifolia]|uniref:NAC domain-containing protein 83-like n=1 Tax=Typha latifolia TaxID=4733 RepID=UPI003C2D3B4B